MSLLFSEFQLKGHILRNRVVLPPMVCFGYATEDGFVTEKNLRHYQERSEDGPGLVITEATCVDKNGKTALRQLGIWNDDHIDGLSKIASIVKGNGAVSLIQIHHAGLVTPLEVSDKVAGPSAIDEDPRTRMLQVDEIGALIKMFTGAALRARKAGFDGIELHGSHGYLLNQFASAFWNKREDEWGGSLENRMRFAEAIIKGIRNSCGEDFILGYRMGANSPLLEDGKEIAKYLGSLGLDYLHVSHGGSLLNLPRPPKDFDYNWIVYSGIEIKKQVTVPVITVNEIKTFERAEWLLQNNYTDLISLGRPQLADPFWVKHTRDNEPVNLCQSCKPKCKWYQSSDLCPAYKKLHI